MYSRYTSLVLLGLAAAQLFDPIPVGPISISIAPSAVSSLSPLAICLANCAWGDAPCQATCTSVPSPDAAQLATMKECEAACPQGDSACVQLCVSSTYDTGTGTMPAGGTATSGSAGAATVAAETTVVGDAVASGSSASSGSGRSGGGETGSTTGSAGM